MFKPQIIKGFSKLSKDKKISLVASYFEDPKQAEHLLKSFWHDDPEKQNLFDEFSENTITNYFFPFGIAPNFLVNGKMFMLPLVVEESSVVAAAANSAKFWADYGGFHAEIISTTKIGQVHFIWEGDKQKLRKLMPALKKKMLEGTMEITENMRERGGGILDIELVNMTEKIDHYYQLKASFETVDSMGANFINSCLEEFVTILKRFMFQQSGLTDNERNPEVIMAILSNYTPECLVKVQVECPIEALANCDENLSAEKFAWKFEKAVEIAKVDTFRATTHNKGIFNGIDAVALATGQDFRAIEACGHTYAARSGQYSSLTDLRIENGKFNYSLTIPLALGTVGGLTVLHPMARFSLGLLDDPDAKELMMISAAAGLANNYSAIKSLVTKGIQVGHMRMHLFNILNQIGVTSIEKEKALVYFKDRKISFQHVQQMIAKLRHNKSAQTN